MHHSTRSTHPSISPRLWWTHTHLSGKAMRSKKVINTSFALKTMHFMRSPKKIAAFLCYAHFSCKVRLVGIFFPSAHWKAADEHYGWMCCPVSPFLRIWNILTIVLLRTKIECWCCWWSAFFESHSLFVGFIETIYLSGKFLHRTNVRLIEN